MTEKSNLENNRMEIAHPGKYQNRKCTTWKMPKWKLHALENDRKFTPLKMTENLQLEFARMEKTQPGPGLMVETQK